MILARRWLERMEERREAELAQETDVVIELAKALGQSEVQRKWEGWNYRRLLAEAEGREFNEPPPSFDYDEEDDC